MTVSYQYDVASSTSAGFLRLLRKWKGSVYKLIYRELIIFLILFALISALYRLVLSDEAKRSFEKIVAYCDEFVNLIPLSFILGFYVSFVATRWWQQFENIPWPDKLCYLISLYLEGYDESIRVVRRTLTRYLNTSLVLCLRSISSAVKKRFPTTENLVEAGIMTKQEAKIYDSCSSIEYNTYWVPCIWFVMLLQQTKQSDRVDSIGLKLIMEEFNVFRGKMNLLWCYDWVSIPLVYTQVVTITTYAFFFFCLMGRQYVEGKTTTKQIDLDIYFPLYTILQFFFYMGLLKVAEQLINPFGEDDEDFELNWLIDRHITVSYVTVDTFLRQIPSLEKDMYFDHSTIQLPYTKETLNLKKPTYRGSGNRLNISDVKPVMVLPEIQEENESRKGLRKRSSFLTLFSSSPNVNRRFRFGYNRSRSVQIRPNNAKFMNRSNVPGFYDNDFINENKQMPNSQQIQNMVYNQRPPLLVSLSAQDLREKEMNNYDLEHVHSPYQDFDGTIPKTVNKEGTGINPKTPKVTLQRPVAATSARTQHVFGCDNDAFSMETEKHPNFGGSAENVTGYSSVKVPRDDERLAEATSEDKVPHFLDDRRISGSFSSRESSQRRIFLAESRNHSKRNSRDLSVTEKKVEDSSISKSVESGK